MRSVRSGRPSRFRSCSIKASGSRIPVTTTSIAMPPDPMLRRIFKQAIDLRLVARRPQFRRNTVRVGFALMAGLAGGAPAQSTNVRSPNTGARANTVFDVTVGASRSDNVRRTATDEVEDTLASIGLISDVAH